MTTATQHAEAIILLDAARRGLEQAVGQAYSAMALLLRRLDGAWHYIPEEHRAAFREQVEKSLALSLSLRDFRDYLNEPRAWAPAKEERE